MKFTYSSGQRPLDGFTLKRGVGAGGFGEVYYALSDGGKEVALKMVRGQQEVELRGMAQCLNLKDPHLVSLYDMKTDAHGDRWVVMEYVAGETLNVVLNRHPHGLPLELAQQWFLSLCRAVAYLHEHGIVHRDLKPGNIFIENGMLKVGDYGLSKFISSSQRTAQTQSVGTVYYMAPEISTGNYNKQIDIYAAGVILYEMLTGRVPFEGESAGEILMKHLTAPPDLGKLPAEYIPIIGKALAKNPAQRYATIGEMAKAVEAAAAGVQPLAAKTPAAVTQPLPAVPRATVEELPSVLPAYSVRGQVAELAGSLALAAVLAVLLATLYAALAQVQTFSEAGSVLFLTIAISWAVLVPSKFWNQRHGDTWLRRVVLMVLGTGIGIGALWLNGLGQVPDFSHGLTASAGPVDLWEQPASAGEAQLSMMAKFVSYFALALCALRWWRLADRNRTHRFSCFPVIAAGFWALVLYPFVWPPSEAPYGAIALVTSAVIIQWVSPWEQPQPRSTRRLRLRYA